MPSLPVHVTSRRGAALVIAIAIALAAVVLGLPAPSPTEPTVSSGLPTSYQSAVAELRQQRLPDPGVAPALVVFSRSDGSALGADQLAAVEQRAPALLDLAVEAPAAAGSGPTGEQRSPVQTSEDSTVALVAVPLATDGEVSAVADTVTQLRQIAERDLPDGVIAQVTGGPAYIADLTRVFDGANTRLLLATLAVVALLLVVTYRSPTLWLVPLAVVALAEQVTTKLVDLLAPVFGLYLDESGSGITSVIVFGAATNYSLLLIARYREQLRAESDRFEAMRVALRRTSESVAAAGATVVLSLLTLLLAQQQSLRGLGFSAAVGIAVAMLSALVVLPAAMVMFGRRLFWPFVPRVGDPPQEGRLWGRVGELVSRRPQRIGLAATGVLLLASLAATGVTVGLSQTEQFRVKPEAVAGQKTLERAFPAGTTEPVAVLTTPGSVPAVTEALAQVEGVSSTRPGAVADGVAQVDVVLQAAPGTSDSYDTVRALRSRLAEVPGADAVVGGQVATSLDVRDAADRDLRVVAPLVLLVVALVLVVLLRALLAPALLVLTVLGTFFASLGISWLLFSTLLGFPALDTLVLLLSFLFLVALGVDYNIFLVTRAREEARTHGTQDGMLRALRATGGVITSAGILLAAVFAVLGVLPLLALAQIGVIVGVGVLLDTLLVRTVLVPALGMILGERFWWPTRVHRPEEL